MNPVAVLNIQVNAMTGKAVANIQALDTQLKKTAVTSNAATARIAKAAKFGGAALAVGVAAGLYKSVKAANAFESSFAEVRKTVDASEKGFDRLERGMRRLSRTIPVNVNELNDLAGQAGALGVKSRDIVKFTRTAAELGIATDMSASDAANALARLSNIMGTSSKDFRRLGSSFVALGNDGASTEREIADMALRLAATGKQVGLNEAQVLSFSSALASVGIEAEAGGSAFSRAFSIMSEAVATGNANLEGFAEVAGMTSQRFSRLFERDASLAMVEFVEGLGQIKREGGNALVTLKDLDINEIRLRNSLLSAAGAGKLFRDQLKVGSEAWRENNALTKEAEARYATTDAKLQLLGNQVNDVAITIGQSMRPAVKRALDALSGFVSRIGDVWSKTNLTTEQKLNRTLEIVSDGMGDLIAAATKKLGELAPVILKATAKLGLEMARGLVEGFMKSDLLGKLFTAAVLIRMIGGRGALAAVGARIGSMFGVSVAAGAATGMGAGLGGAAAGGGIVGAATKALGGIKWARVGAVSIGAFLAEGAISEFQRYMTVRGGDLMASLQEQAKSGWLESKLADNKFLPVQLPGLVNDNDESAAKRMLEILEKMQQVGGQRLLDLAAEGRQLAANVEKADEVRAALERATKPVEGARFKFDFNLETLNSGLITRMQDIKTIFRKNMAEINVGWEKGTSGWRDATARNMTGVIGAIRNGMRSGAIPETKQNLDLLKKLIHERKLVTGKDPFAIAKGFRDSWASAKKITPQMINQVLTDMQKMPKGARQEAIQTMLQMARELRNKGVLPQRAVKNLTSAIVTRFGLTRKQSLRATGNLISGVSRGFSSLAGAVGNALGNIGSNVGSILKAFSVSSGFSFTVRNLGAAGKALGNLFGLQKGGLVPGTGNGDKVPMVLPHGSFVLNKKATAALGYHAKGGSGVGNVLLEPGERVFYPQEVRQIGESRLTKANRSVPRFQGGGMFKLPKPKIGGPDPLRAAGQAGVDKAHAEAKEYLDKKINVVGGGNIVALGKSLQRLGYEVGEHPAFGGVAPVHTDGSYHYQGRALDVNDDVNPRGGSEMASLDWLNSQLQRVPGVVELLWRVANHYDHLHVAMQRGGQVGDPPGFKWKHGQIVDRFARPIRRMAKGGPAKDGPTAMASRGGRLFPYQVVQYAAKGGWPGRLLRMVTAIAGAESGFNPRAHNTAGEDSRGLMQINVGPGANPQYAGKNLFHPLINMRVARRIYKGVGNSFTPWSTYTNGRYRDFWGQAGHAVKTALRVGLDGPSAADRREARNGKIVKARRAKMEKLWRLAKAAKKNPLLQQKRWWDIIDAYARWGDFGAGKSKEGREFDQGKRFLGTVRSIRSTPDRVRRGYELGLFMPWLAKNVDIGSDKPDQRFLARYGGVKKKAGKKYKRNVKRAHRFYEYSNFGELMKEDLGWLTRNAKKRKVLSELLDIAHEKHNAEWGEGGGEYTDKELAKETKMARRMKRLLVNRLDKIDESLPLARSLGESQRSQYEFIKKNRPLQKWMLPAIKKTYQRAERVTKRLRGDRTELVGASGSGGALNEIRFKLKELGVTDTIEKAKAREDAAGISFGDLSRIIEFARHGGYDQLPKFHTGGDVGGSSHSEIMAILKGREGVFTQPQMGAIHEGLTSSPAASGPVDVNVVLRWADDADPRLKALVVAEVEEDKRSRDQRVRAGVR